MTLKVRLSSTLCTLTCPQQGGQTEEVLEKSQLMSVHCKELMVRLFLTSQGRQRKL